MSIPLSNEDVVERLTAAAKGAGPNDFTPKVHFTLLLEARDEIDRMRNALAPFAIAALAGEKRYGVLKAAGEGVMDQCDGFMDIAKRHLSVANFRATLTALDGVAK